MQLQLLLVRDSEPDFLILEKPNMRLGTQHPARVWHKPRYCDSRRRRLQPAYAAEHWRPAGRAAPAPDEGCDGQPAWVACPALPSTAPTAGVSSGPADSAANGPGQGSDGAAPAFKT
jgi:hypothetical protein